MLCGVCCVDGADDLKVPVVAVSSLSHKRGPWSSTHDEEVPKGVDGAGESPDGVGNHLGADIFGRVRLACHGAEGMQRGFPATLRVQRDGVGAQLLDHQGPAGRALIVANIEVGGPIFWYNQRVDDEERMILLGDLIASVNGIVEDPDEMRKAIGTGDAAEVIVRRPHTFTVNGLWKQGRPLGIRLASSYRDSVLVVKQLLDDGATAAWNRSAPEEYRIQKGDTIVSVNGVSGDVEAMRHLIAESDELDLVFRRTF